MPIGWIFISVTLWANYSACYILTKFVWLFSALPKDLPKWLDASLTIQPLRPGYSQIVVNLASPEPGYTTWFIEYRRIGDSQWQNVRADVRAERVSLGEFADGTYEVRIQLRSELGDSLRHVPMVFSLRTLSMMFSLYTASLLRNWEKKHVCKEEVQQGRWLLDVCAAHMAAA